MEFRVRINENTFIRQICKKNWTPSETEEENTEAFIVYDHSYYLQRKIIHIEEIACNDIQY
jgi:hypothetical protein